MSRLSKLVRRALGRVPEFSHQSALRRIKAADIAISSIYDIGAYHGRWTDDAEAVFPDASFVLFEANHDHGAMLNAKSRRWFNVALGSDDHQRREFFVPELISTSGASFYRDPTPNQARRSLTTVKLDTVVTRESLPLPDLIKLDVQGSEIDVLGGAPRCLEQCQIIIAETSFAGCNNGAPIAADVISWLRQRGFSCVDIAETHRCDRSHNLIEVDFVFAAKTAFEKLRA